MREKSIIVTLVLLITFLMTFTVFYLGIERVPSDEEAEVVVLDFMNSFYSIQHIRNKQYLINRMYSRLSKDARKKISIENFITDAALFMGIESLTDTGISIKEINRISMYTVVVGMEMEYSGGRIIRRVELIVEDREWRIDRVISG